MTESIQQVVLIIFLTFLSGYYSCSEAALFSLSLPQIKTFKIDPNPRKKLIADLLSRPRDLLVTVFMLNTLVNILLQNVVSDMFGDVGHWALKIGVPLGLTLVFGEIIPKYLGIQNNVRYAYALAPSINLAQRWLGPVRKAIVAVTAPISKILFFFLKKEENISKEELEHVMKTSQEHGVFDADESDLICGYLELQDSSIKELMQPRGDIIFFDIEEPLSKLLHLFSNEKISFLPVCEKDLDHILGIISAKQYFFHRDAIRDSKDLITALQKPFYVPESTSGRLLLRKLKEKNEPLALVVDEYGSISGLISRKDLLEMVIGEFSNEREKKELYTRAGKAEIIASGKLELEEFNEIFGVNFDSPGSMVTIGGWLTEYLGEIPKSGSKYEVHNFLFQILSSTPSRIRRLYIRRLK